MAPGINSVACALTSVEDVEGNMLFIVASFESCCILVGKRLVQEERFSVGGGEALSTCVSKFVLAHVSGAFTAAENLKHNVPPRRHASGQVHIES